MNSCAVSTGAKWPSARRAPITDRWAKFVGNFWVRKSNRGVRIEEILDAVRGILPGCYWELTVLRCGGDNTRTHPLRACTLPG
jgi:hypothetical protein